MTPIDARLRRDTVEARAILHAAHVEVPTWVSQTASVSQTKEG